METNATPENITALMQSQANAFWAIEAAIAQHEEMGERLTQMRADMSKTIRSMRSAYPEAFAAFDMVAKSNN